MANILPNDRVAAEKVARNPKCARCRNHGLVVPLKGHSGQCQFKPCVCWKCSLIAERTKILASQRRIKTGIANESSSDDRPIRSGGKRVAAAENNVTIDVDRETDTSARQESVKAHVQRADIDDPPHIPGEYIITEAIPRHIFPGEMFAMPLPMYPHYPDRYMCPAVLVTLRSPAPGPFREPLGFLPSPPAASSHLLESPESQFQMPCYSPYPTYPVLRDEHGPRPRHLMDGEQGIPKDLPEQSHVGCNQESEIIPADGLSSKNTA
ncbi:doublesex- and mab-3-related transcription factor 1-like isoform X2 [Triplophysa dalaica]|uniref:doublesex- and mab-3-related transcription factor 1-like isoform X2 n=1 Tax=Triplophysa dalaica TaxID=1582913 RepID=UPI0024DF34E6|nr:doublesex- and mab-3-related transcription factor 1-like isoform X2 [Triplophysa dalaica]